MNEKWAAIINPAAGKKRGTKDWPLLDSLFHDFQLDVTPFISENQGAPRLITKDLILQGYQRFIAIGGDGTMNEIADALLGQPEIPSNEFIITQIPTGTGNDWQKTYSGKKAYKDAVQRISEGKTFLQDAGCIEYLGINGKTEKKHFINAAGIGFDADVTKKVNLQGSSGSFGKLIYLITLLTSLLKSRHFSSKIIIDNEVLDDVFFNITIGIGKFSGGGMMFLPDAIPDDGLFDLTVIRKITKKDVIRNVKNLYDGSFIKHPSVKLYKSTFVRIESTDSPGIEIDGEYIGTSPATFRLIPECLKVVI